MNPNGQRLLNHGSTARALLGGMARINQHDHPTSILSFVRGVYDQLMPGCIRDAFCQTMILKHVFTIQPFKGYHAETIYPFTAQFMREIPALIGNTLMDMLNRLASLRSLRGSLLRLREFTLGFGQCLLLPAKEAWIFNLHAIGQGSKSFKPHINPHSPFIEWQRLSCHFTSKAGIPIIRCIPLDRERFYAPFQGSVKYDFHDPDLGKPKPMIQKFKTKLFEGEAVIPALTSKARITRLLTRLHPAKEGFESKIHSLLNILQHLRVHTFQFRMFLFPDGEQFVRVIQRKRSALLLPGIFANGQRLIVDPTAELQGLHQPGSLALVLSQAIFERFHSDLLLVSEGMLPISNRSTANRRDQTGMGQQGRKSAFQWWKLLTKKTRANTFCPLHKLMRSVWWINYAKNINSVWHPFPFPYFATHSLGNWIDDFFQVLNDQALIDTTHQNPALGKLGLF